jgi:hypothetical protein
MRSRRLVALASAGLLALLVTGPALAKGKHGDGAKKLAGTVTMVDAKARTLEIRHGKNESKPKRTSFQLAPDAEVTSASGKAEGVRALAVGQHVTVTYAMEGDARMAKAVEVEDAAKP